VPTGEEEPIKLIAETTTVEAIRVNGGIAEVKDGNGGLEVRTVVYVSVEARVSGHSNRLTVDMYWTTDQARLVAQRLIESAYMAEKEANRGGL
jgi:hypothetical protein